MTGWSLDKAAERFDELYTRMTALQRRLIAAVREGDEDSPRTRELVEEARTVIAACDAAARALNVGYDARRVEAEALRARVLQPPLVEVLVMAAARSLTREYGYRLLADAITIAAESAAAGAAFGEDAAGSPPGVWRERTVLDLLSAPQTMGEFSARRVAEHIGIEPEAHVAELGDDERVRLVAGLRECADALPDGVRGAGRPPKLPADGVGAGRDVLDRWIDVLGSGTDPVRQAARAAAQRDGWSVDAVPVAERLVAFTDQRLMPLPVPNFEALAAERDFEQRLLALRAEERSYREQWWEQHETDEAAAEQASLLAYLVGKHIEALRAGAKARQLADLPEEQWRSGSPLSNARSAARRCGEILAGFDETVVELLGELPGGG